MIVSDIQKRGAAEKGQCGGRRKIVWMQGGIVDGGRRQMGWEEATWEEVRWEENFRGAKDDRE